MGLSSQLPRIDIVGLPEASVRESAARVRSAIQAIDRRFPDRRVTVNLAPASFRKAGAGLDLAIAVGIMAAAGEIEAARLSGRAFIGELALDGRLRPVEGALALALALRDAGCREIIVAAGCAAQASVAPGVEIRGATGLDTVVAHLMGGEALPIVRPEWPQATGDVPSSECLADVRGQEHAKRALLIAAAGGHGVFLQGPPGAGKTMLAKRLPGLLPPLSPEEAIEATRIHGAAGLLGRERPMLTSRPFRAPHHTASAAGLLGGGRPPRPGEISLAHRGVLFLDELPEFERRCLEALRQVIEDRAIVLARAHGTVRFPADFTLVAAANPCPCGWYRSGQRDCRCDDATVARYHRRLSGPLLDRFDLHVRVRGVSWRELAEPKHAERSQSLRHAVATARALQCKRAGCENGRLPDAALGEWAALSRDAHRLLGRAVDRLGLSARAARRSQRVARTIADLEGEAEISSSAMAEALGFRAEQGVESAPIGGPR